jgi:hypothetical protein
MKYFRQRMWGTLTMAQAFLLDKDCWFSHMALDPATGLDPPGVKIRASGGLDAVDYLMPGYWVFGRLVEALAAIGYDHNNMVRGGAFLKCAPGMSWPCHGVAWYSRRGRACLAWCCACG